MLETQIRAVCVHEACVLRGEGYFEEGEGALYIYVEAITASRFLIDRVEPYTG